ncbi:MAG: PaaX family transcriptional regulator C-terminal domain-containing protein [Jiangellaceae bacterium]
MNARSALFDLYGDHLRSRGGRAPVASLVALLAPLDIAAPAVRTAVSRMVKQGWLQATRVAGASGYALTARAESRLEEAAARIYRTRTVDGWDARWHLVVPNRPPDRAGRERLKGGLAFLGYAPIGDGAWVAARPSPELDALLAAEGVHAERFAAAHETDDADLVRRAWDLDAVGHAYLQWLTAAQVLVDALPAEPSDETAFAVRSQLVHEWRKFLFTDPGLPRGLLPRLWPGDVAAAFFDAQAARLLPASARFVDQCLSLAARGNGADR